MLFNRKLSIDNHVQIVHINPMLILLIFSLTWNVLSNLFYYSGAAIWNKLPTEAQNASSIGGFKNIYKQINF